ncbi:MAG: hypothetical protein JWQ21_3552 [Herminiimonas sp.]|nr:hypothetical protein [Herminiimonas sp.]
MFRKTITIFFTIAALVSATGCSTLADARGAKGSGVSRVYEASAETVWKAMPTVLSEVGLQLVGDNRTEGYILAQRGITAFSYGENVAIFIESVGGVTKTRVEAVSKKAMATNIFAPSWEKEILDKLGEKLKVKSST